MESIDAGARQRQDAAAGLDGKREMLQIHGEAALAGHAEQILLQCERPLLHARLGSSRLTRQRCAQLGSDPTYDLRTIDRSDRDHRNGGLGPTQPAG